MTALDPRSDRAPATARPARTTIDLTAAEAAGPSAPQAGPRPAGPSSVGVADENDAHLLRLCLDLQLDALLLTLGAAAAEQVHVGAAASGGVPWRRWVDEDVELATTLAADALAGRATLPPTLGSELDHQVPATVVDNLVARYESMRDLLTDLLYRDTAAHDDRWRPRVRDALRQCRSRLAELREYRISGTPPQGVRLPEPAASRLAAEHHYLPGELLG